jgi:hypothetical protein
LGLKRISGKAREKRQSEKMRTALVVEADGDTLRFRRPVFPDLYTTAEDVLAVRVEFPGLPDAFYKDVISMGRCYLADATDDAGLDPVLGLAELAMGMPSVFVDVKNKFNEAFADVFDLAAAVDEAKNDSTQ